MSSFDDLLNFGDSSSSTSTGDQNQSANPFGLTTNQSGGGGGEGDLLGLDLGFDAPITTQNASSGKVNFEANTNPLYELSNNSQPLMMEGETSNNTLFDLSPEPTKEPTKMETSGNPLYDYFQSEATTNGHGDGETVLTNGGGNGEVDLLGFSGDAGASGAVISDDSGVTLDSNFLSESNLEVENETKVQEQDLEAEVEPASEMNVPEQDFEPEPEQESEMKVPDQDLQPEVEPESEMRVPEQDLQPEVEQEEQQEAEPEPVQDKEPEVEEVEQVSEPEEQKQVVKEAAVEQNGTAEPGEVKNAPASVSETQPDKKDEPAEQEGDKAETRDAQNEAEAPKDEPKAVDANPAPQQEKADETPDTMEEVKAADQEPEVEAGKAQETESEIVMPAGSQESSIPEAEPQGEPEEQPSSESQEPALGEQNKVEALDKVEAKPDDNKPEPDEAPAKESSQDESPVPEEACLEEPAEQVVREPESEQGTPASADVVQAPAEPEPETIEVEQAAPESAEVEQAPPESIETEQAAPATTEVKQAPAEPEQAPTASELEQAAPEPESEQAAPEIEPEQAAPEPEQAMLVPTEVEQAPTEPEHAASEPELEQAAPESIETEQADPATMEVKQPAAPVEVVQAEATEPVEAEPEIPESDVVKPVEEQLPTEQPAAVVEGNKEEEIAPEEQQEEQPKEQPAQAVVENTNAGNEDQIVPDSPVTEARPDDADTAPAEDGVAKTVNGTNEVKENGVTEEEAVRDPSIFRETREKEEIHFAELNNFRQKFESGKIDDKEPEPKKTSIKDEYDQGGEYENEPVQNPDVVKGTDRPSEPLPEAGTAKNLLDKFKTIQAEKSQTVTSQKRVSPPREDKVEYESTPTERLVIEEGKSEMGEFESTPQTREDVIRSQDRIEDAVPESGYAKNIMNRFKEIGSGSGESQPRGKRELTPDSSGKVEYTSEPRGQKIQYEETRVDAGVFENQPKRDEEDVVRAEDRPQDWVPESGMAKNLLSKFKQMETEAGNRPPPSPKRELRSITPDRSGKIEYVSEPRGSKIVYEEQKEEQGVFESKPSEPVEVVRSGEPVDDIKPEAGSAKKTMERYKELQKQSSSPVSSTPRKEFTPPRETSPGKNVVGTFESTPTQAKQDVVRSGDRIQDELPEQGSAKNILNKFKEIQTSAGASPADSPTKKPKEFTPPPESGIYENTPTDHLVIEEQKGFDGILENTPSTSQADVSRNRDQSVERELPETGTAKNLVSKFRQLETSSKNSTSASPRQFKEFTPPRDRGPLSPKSPAGQPSGGVDLNDLPSQYHEQTDKPGVFENEPEVRPDVYREKDTDWEKDMPAPNTTMSMLQKFKSIQNQAKENEKTPAPVSRKDESHTSPEPEENQEDNIPQEMETPNETERPAANAESNGTEGSSVIEILAMEAENNTAAEFTVKVVDADAERRDDSDDEVENAGTVTDANANVEATFSVPLPQEDDADDEDKENTNDADNEKPDRDNVDVDVEYDVDAVEDDEEGVENECEADVQERAESPEIDSQQVERKDDTEQIVDVDEDAAPEQYQDEISQENDQPEEEEDLVEVGQAIEIPQENYREDETTPEIDRQLDDIPQTDEQEPDVPEPDEADIPQTNGHANIPETETNIPEETKDDSEEEEMEKSEQTSSVRVGDIMKKFSNKNESESNTVSGTAARFGAPAAKKEKAMFKVVQTEKCDACQKTVYAMEKLEMNGHVYHKNCFKCSHCSARLTPKTFSMNEGVIYCVNHFKQLFARKGNYDEGFGRQQYKKKWNDPKKEVATA